MLQTFIEQVGKEQPVPTHDCLSLIYLFPKLRNKCVAFYEIPYSYNRGRPFQAKVLEFAGFFPVMR